MHRDNNSRIDNNDITGGNGGIVGAKKEAEMTTVDGKRCLAAIVGLVVGSVVTILMKYPAEAYIKLAGLMYGAFAVAQTITDIVENKKGETK